MNERFSTEGPHKKDTSSALRRSAVDPLDKQQQDRRDQADSRRFTLVVSLWLKRHDIPAFEAYEKKAARLLANHGGRVDRAIRIKPGEGDPPFEVHVVSFPDRDRYLGYRADPEVRALVEERNRIIGRTVVLEGEDVKALE